MSDKVKVSNSQWDLFTNGATLPLIRLIELWSSEDGATKEDIVNRLSSILERSNDYMIVHNNLTVPDPTVAHLLKKLIKKGRWQNVSAEAYDKPLMKSFHGGNKKVSNKLADSKTTVSLKDLSVDCDIFYEVVSGFGLPIPDFLRLIVGETPTKLSTTPTQAEPQPTANTEQPLLSVRDFCTAYPSFKEGGIRHYIFNEKSNGLSECGAITRMGRKVLINVEKFFEWAKTNGKTG
jgi:hypothetical protein